MKLNLVLISFVFLFSVFLIANVFAQVSVGVKEGDWIEYSVNYTGSPPDSYPKWIRLDVADVQGTIITVDLKVESLYGSTYTNGGDYDLEEGVPNLLLIPADLDVGDKFYHEDYGKNSITERDVFTYAGVERTVVSSTIENIVLHWDKSTGILLQTDYAIDDYRQKLLVDKTNMWGQQTFGSDTLFYVLIATIMVIIVIVAVFLLRRR